MVKDKERAHCKNYIKITNQADSVIQPRFHLKSIAFILIETNWEFILSRHIMQTKSHVLCLYFEKYSTLYQNYKQYLRHE